MAKKNNSETSEPRSRLPLNRARIMATAVEIADEGGVSAVTMRAVASRLGVEAMSLYNHVANKDDILDGMVDLVIEQFTLPADIGDWRAAMRDRAVSAHQVFGEHPWAPLLLDSRESSGESRLRYYDWVLGTLIKAGFTEDGAVRAFSLIDSYIYGFGIQQINFSTEGSGSPQEKAAAILSFIPQEKYPYLHRQASNALAKAYEPDADFEFGLGIILNGLEALLEASG